MRCLVLHHQEVPDVDSEEFEPRVEDRASQVRVSDDLLVFDHVVEPVFQLVRGHPLVVIIDLRNEENQYTVIGCILLYTSNIGYMFSPSSLLNFIKGQRY